jgi:3-phosphoshikimate 1-carboxyvinyltransferase
MHTYPEQLEIVPLMAPPHCTASVPGSKSITNRALVLAALCSRTGPCTLTGALQSEDTEVMLDCLTLLGFVLEADWRVPKVVVYQNPSDRIIPATSADLFVGNSGTTVRFLTAMLALGQGTYRLDGVPRMRERPIQDLLDALGQLGIDARSETGNGCPPVVIRSSGWPDSIDTKVIIHAEKSSQFLSAFLMAAPFGWGTTKVRVTGAVVSEPYIEMTIQMAFQWGLFIPADGPRGYEIPAVGGLGWPQESEYVIEPDASAASYFFASAAICGGSITVRGMKRDMLQGDVKFVDCLEQMGCRVEYGDDGITVRGATLRGIDVDMNAISDTVMTLAAVACFADGPTTIRNVAHIRHKETDRIAAVATELRKLGAEVDEFPDGLRITPRPLTGCAVDTYNDHRMAMSLALVGLKVPGVVIRNPGCVAKTYPGFWQDFEKLRG